MQHAKERVREVLSRLWDWGDAALRRVEKTIVNKLLPKIDRRTALVMLMASGGLIRDTFADSKKTTSAMSLSVVNVTGLYAVQVNRIAVISTLPQVVEYVKNWPGQIAVGGGRYSMGGQVAIEGGLHLDMRGMNRLIWLKPDKALVRVQAGMRWRQLQEELDRYDLSVRTMQSYSNFTVGGSVSVNVHGRYVGHGAMIESIQALQIVVADGVVVEASRTQNSEVFFAAIGGYGALGVITEVELRLDANSKIQRSVARIDLDDYVGFFQEKIKKNPLAVMHNADLLPPYFNSAYSVTWVKTQAELTAKERLVRAGKPYAIEQAVIWAVTELPGGAKAQQKVIRPLLDKSKPVVMRNYEASLDAAVLEPKSRDASTYVLQEYFVPIHRFKDFVMGLQEVIAKYGAKVLNVSIRHAPQDKESLMAWAQQEVFSFVIYYKQNTDAATQAQVGQWTRELISLALKLAGTYYLPYQLHASLEQFRLAYPNHDSFLKTKLRFDPNKKFTNQMWKRYLSI